jgi:mannose-6-phosphate isomerase
MGMTSPDLLRFTPIYQPRIWGGRRLETSLGRTLPDGQPYGESWELVDRETDQSVVACGPLAGRTLQDLWANDRDAIFGAAYACHPSTRFPLLVKVLDCVDDLSIQVHPPAEIAEALNGEPKTEMWFVARADPGSSLYLGVKEGVGREVFETALKAGAVADCVHSLHPSAGDSVFVHSGRLHALGKGLVIYEIQQNSDTTYRVFDWNRMGLDGVPRQLHVEESMQCIDFADVEPSLLGDGTRACLADCEFFMVTRRHAGDGHQVPGGRFRLIMAVSAVQWAGETVNPGEVALMPACKAVAGHPEPAGDWLEIELPCA